MHYFTSPSKTAQRSTEDKQSYHNDAMSDVTSNRLSEMHLNPDKHCHSNGCRFQLAQVTQLLE